MKSDNGKANAPGQGSACKNRAGEPAASARTATDCGVNNITTSGGKLWPVDGNTEGSRNVPKGAKGAASFVCSLLHPSRTLGANLLTKIKHRAYSDLVAKKDATGFGDLNYTRRTTATRRYFFVQAIASPMSGGGGDTFGYAGFLVYRFANPATCRSPRLATGTCGSSPHKEATMPSINSPVQNSLITPVAPFTYAGGDLALCDHDEPWIYFFDQSGRKWLTHSTEFVLRNIDHFPIERGQDQLLAAAALHYDLDVWTLINGATHESH